jgi:molybdopterin converting factor small subunit
VQALVRQLDVPEEMASVIVLNDRGADFTDALHEGDRVTLIPPLAGG